MNTIYFKKVSYDFLMQAVKILHTNEHDKYELDIVYDFIIQLTDETIYSYMEKKTIISYDNDFELFIQLIDRLIEILENEVYEEYEKCRNLLNKKEYCKKLLTKINQ